MKLSTSSFIVTGRNKITGRATYVHVTMRPSDTQPQIDEPGLDIRYKVKANIVSPLIYWFMLRVLHYRTA